jgi:DNA-binding transcriptional LysR family regulator
VAAALRGRRPLADQPGISASSGETVRQLALEGQGICCLSNFMTIDDINTGRLVPVLEAFNTAIASRHAVFYRNSQLALRIQCFLDFIQSRWRGMRADA